MKCTLPSAGSCSTIFFGTGGGLEPGFLGWEAEDADTKFPFDTPRYNAKRRHWRKTRIGI